MRNRNRTAPSEARSDEPWLTAFATTPQPCPVPPRVLGHEALVARPVVCVGFRNSVVAVTSRNSVFGVDTQNAVSRDTS